MRAANHTRHCLYSPHETLSLLESRLRCLGVCSALYKAKVTSRTLSLLKGTKKREKAGDEGH
jgi:hypothetical protein